MTTPAAAGAPIVAAVRPEPEPAVLAAIVAAVQEAWPRAEADDVGRRAGSIWRFSGRWWVKPTAARRDRPWARR
ncbi:MAG TPA: hypothetical protein VED63_12490 [Acidimicrobiales bacterium]|nr:hypothetical protein [Acidimicrobiales bacterium]